MEYKVSLCIDEVKKWLRMAANERLDPLRQGLAQLKVPAEQGGPSTQADRDRLIEALEEHGVYLSCILERIRVLIDNLCESDGRPSYPGGELLPNEPPTFKAQS
jgi:hypothetical protein